MFIFSDCLFVTSQVLFLVLNFINCDFLISRDSLFSETYIRRARDSGSFQSAGITENGWENGRENGERQWSDSSRSVLPLQKEFASEGGDFRLDWASPFPSLYHFL